METKRRRSIRVAALALNALVFLLEMVGLVMSVRQFGWEMLQFYTQDSNYIALVASGAMAVAELLCLAGKREKVARWIALLQYVSVCMLSVTFLVVLFVLAPAYGGGSNYWTLFSYGTMLYHHLLCPVLSFVAFVFFERDSVITKRDAGLALLPTVAYAIVAITLNVLRVLEGPYPFLHVYEQPVYLSVVWFVIILGGAYLIARLVRLTRMRALRRAI